MYMYVCSSLCAYGNMGMRILACTGAFFIVGIACMCMSSCELRLRMRMCAFMALHGRVSILYAEAYSKMRKCYVYVKCVCLGIISLVRMCMRMRMFMHMCAFKGRWLSYPDA